MSNNEDSYGTVFVWELKNFNRNCVGVELWSPVFEWNALDNSQWRIALCVDNYDNDSSYFFNFRLKCVSNEVLLNKIDCELSITDVNGSPLQKIRRKNCDFSTLSYYSLESLKVVDDIFGLSDSQFFPKNTLTIRCQMQNNSSQSRKIIPEMHSLCIKIERSSFLWTLENFCRLQPFQKSKIHLMQNDSSSPVISFDFFFDDYERFQVKVLPNSCCAPIDASFKICILDANMQVCKTEDFSFSKSFTLLSLKRKELVNNKSLYLPMGILSLQVECFFIIKDNINENAEQFSYEDLYAIRDIPKDTVNPEMKPPENLVASPLEEEVSMTDKCNSSSHGEFFRNMQQLYEEGLYTDAKLIVDFFGKRTFPVHRSFLSARYPFFKTLFSETEKYEAFVSMDSDGIMLMSSECMKKLPHFAYSERLEEDMDLECAIDLFTSAGFHDLHDLKQATRCVIISKLTASNQMEIYENMPLYNGDIRSAYWDFMKKIKTGAVAVKQTGKR